MPAATGRIPRASIILTTVTGSAPRAIRMPTSEVLCATAYAQLQTVQTYGGE